MFTMEEVRIANATSRSNGASAKNKDGSIRAIVPKYVAEHVSKEDSILDYGAGKGPLHTKWLREEGFDVTAWDFGDNFIDGVHEKDALSRKYDVVFASNVLNVQSSLNMFLETLSQMYDSLKPGGTLICNYPASPRKMQLTANQGAALIKGMLDRNAVKVGGTAQAPIWKVTKPYEN